MARPAEAAPAVIYKEGGDIILDGDVFNPIEDVSQKCTGAEINTGTDDAKFATSKALKDADLAKAAGTPASADLFYFRTAAGVVKKITLADLATAIDGELNP